MTKVGLLGGSFDPVHLAHVALAETALRILRLDEVQLIPAANPWQREPLAASAEHRLALLRLALAGRPHLRVNPVEIRRGGKTYTIDTLETLPDDAEYYWIFGADQLRNFCTWHRWQDIAGRVHLVVVDRPGTLLDVPPELRELLQTLGRQLIELPFEPMPISASDIRERLASGRPICGMVDAAVEHYIKQNNLYRAPLC